MCCRLKYMLIKQAHQSGFGETPLPSMRTSGAGGRGARLPEARNRATVCPAALLSGRTPLRWAEQENRLGRFHGSNAGWVWSNEQQGNVWSLPWKSSNAPACSKVAETSTDADSTIFKPCSITSSNSDWKAAIPKNWLLLFAKLRSWFSRTRRRFP